MYIPRNFIRSEICDPPPPRRGTLLGRYFIFLFDCCHFHSEGGYFIRSQKPEPPKGYIIWEGCIIWGGLRHPVR